jgi:hypothetical protein
MTESCENCVVDPVFKGELGSSSFDPSDPTTWERMPWNEIAVLYDETTDMLKEIEFAGPMINVNASMNLEFYHRQTDFNMNMLAITSANRTFQSPYSGFIGIAPYLHMSEDSRRRNFLYQLKEQNKISNPIVSISQTDGSSVVKFGSFDFELMADRDDFSMLPTVEDSSWAIQTERSYIYSDSNEGMIELFDKPKKFLIDPQVPFIYLPTSIYN